MKIFLVVHGVVQGVGYRYLVSRAASRNGIRGMVRNAQDGSVEILAEGEQGKIESFEKEINVSLANGPQVFSIEHYREGDGKFPKGREGYDGFVVEE